MAIAIVHRLGVVRIDKGLVLAVGKEVARRAEIRRRVDARPGSDQVVGLHALVLRRERDVAAVLTPSLQVHMMLKLYAST